MLLLMSDTPPRDKKWSSHIAKYVTYDIDLRKWITTYFLAYHPLAQLQSLAIMTNNCQTFLKGPVTTLHWYQIDQWHITIVVHKDDHYLIDYDTITQWNDARGLIRAHLFSVHIIVEANFTWLADCWFSFMFHPT